jgi:hypothetical protein
MFPASVLCRVLPFLAASCRFLPCAEKNSVFVSLAAIGMEESGGARKVFPFHRLPVASPSPNAGCAVAGRHRRAGPRPAARLAPPAAAVAPSAAMSNVRSIVTYRSRVDEIIRYGGSVSNYHAVRQLDRRCRAG